MRNVLVLVGMLMSDGAHAVLIERLGGLAYYDTGADLTWLADANFAQTSGYDTDGRMNWAAANAWANQLVVGGHSGWRLPEIASECGGSFCDDSEMGNLYYNVFEGSGAGDMANWLANNHADTFNLFSNVQMNDYWTANENPTDNFSYAWYFLMRDGYQSASNKSDEYYAWAVRDGDVDVIAVAAPSIFALMSLGFFGLGLARWKPSLRPG